MPVVNVHRWINATINTSYEQAFVNLVIDGPAEFSLGSGPTWTAGTYSLASYSGTFTGSVLDISVNVGATGRTWVPPVVHDATNQRITVTLI